MACLHIIFNLGQPPRPSARKHPVLTFNDICTEAGEDEEQVLLGSHVLLFSPSTLHSTRVSVRLLLSFAPRRGALIQVTAQFVRERSCTDGVYPSSEVLRVFRGSDGGDRRCGAGRQRCSSAKCSSCLPLLPFSLTRCREQESRPRFLTNEDNSMDHIVYADCVSDKLSQLLKSTAKATCLPHSAHRNVRSGWEGGKACKRKAAKVTWGM